ncbi:hypothetical protein J7M07_01125 [bacterium]|nr:hypothetical protein [bacterium]
MMKKRLFTLFVILILVLIASCDKEEKIVEVPIEVPSDCAPSPPRGIDAENRDDFVIIWWDPNPESDIAGYDIYQGDSLYGEYNRIGTVNDETPDPYYYSFEYDGPANGEQHYYGLIAFDEGNNESDFSYIVTATPRYEGLLKLYEIGWKPDSSGYDLSSCGNIAQPYNSVTTDIWIAEDTEGIQKFIVNNLADSIQDYGYVDNFHLINYAPTQGWAPSGEAEIIISHLYVVKTQTEPGSYNYVKLFVVDKTESWARFKWAYQSDPGNTDFSPAPVPGLIERKDDEGRLTISPSFGDR